MATFGIQCDAITESGRRCKCLNRWEIPCIAVYDARCNSYRADEFRPVRLCRQHFWKEEEARKAGKRLKLHHGGWLGPFNEHRYGNLVTSNPIVDWKTVKILKVPKYWKAKTPSPLRATAELGPS